MNPAATRYLSAHSADAGVPSPCTSVCSMDPQRAVCTGCLRSLIEIAAWGEMDDAAKRAVWDLLAQRAAQEAT